MRGRMAGMVLVEMAELREEVERRLRVDGNMA
jgi:hypothetical protein